jgi:hypothetical protein
LFSLLFYTLLNCKYEMNFKKQLILETLLRSILIISSLLLAIINVVVLYGLLVYYLGLIRYTVGVHVRKCK